jgi:hypothetical protein
MRYTSPKISAILRFGSRFARAWLPMAACAALAGCVNPGSIDLTLGPTESPTPSFAGFTGATAAQNLNGTQIKVSWNAGDSTVSAYIIYQIAPDGTMTAVKSASASSTSATMNGLTAGKVYTYRVRARDSKGQLDGNLNDASAITYAGITSSAALSATTAQVNFPSATDAEEIHIYCKVSGGSYSTSPTVIVTNPAMTSATVSGLAAGTAYTCKAVASFDGKEDSNGSTTTVTPIGSAGVLAFSTQPPASGKAGETFTTGPKVSIKDSSGNVVTAGPDATAAVTLSIGSGTGTVQGTATVNAIAGVADFTNLIYIRESGAKKLKATKEDLSSTGGSGTLATSPSQYSTTVTVSTADSPSYLTSTMTVAPETAGQNVANSSDRLAVTITLKDEFGNLMSGQTARFASDVTSDVITQPATSTNTSGVAKGYIKASVDGSRILNLTAPSGLTAVTQTATFLPDLTFSGLVSAQNLDGTRVQLIWASGTGPNIATYRVYEKQTGGGYTAIYTSADASATSTIVTGLSPSTSHTYIVRALDGSGLNSDGNVVEKTAFTYSGISSPATVTSETTATLAFPAAAGSSGINVYCKTSVAASYPTSPTVAAAATATSASLTGLTRNTNYICKARAINPSTSLEDGNTGTVSFKSYDLAFAGAGTVVNLDGTRIQISWTAATGVDIAKYRVYEKQPDSSLTTILTTADATTTSTIITSLTPGTSHTYLVRGLVSDGTVNDGNNIELTAFTYAGISPTYTALSQTSATVNFPAVTNATGINIYCRNFAVSTYPTTPTLTALASATSATVTTLTSAVSWYCKALAVSSTTGLEDNNAAVVLITTPKLAFNGVNGNSGTTTSLTPTSATISWSTGSGADITGYRVYETTTGTPVLLTTLAKTATSYTQTGLTTGTEHRYNVQAISTAGIEDGNTAIVWAMPLGALTASSITTTSVVVSFAATPDMASGQIYCGNRMWYYNQGGGYNVRSSSLTSGSTSTTITGMSSGRTWRCNLYLTGVKSGISYGTANLDFQTTGITFANYKGPMLVQAFGAEPTGANYSGPRGNSTSITWNASTSASSTTSYVVFRTIKGLSFDTDASATCTSSVTTTCRLCTVTGTGAKTCTDSGVAGSPTQYDYLVMQVGGDGYVEELPSGVTDTPYRITVPIPPANMVLVHRDAVNYETCNLQGATSDPLNHQRCAYTGLGGTPYNTSPGNPSLGLSTSYYDFGYNLFVDRWEAGCAWSSTATGGMCGAGATSGNCYGSSAPSSTVGVNGNVYFHSSGNICYVKQAGTWYSTNSGSLSASSLAAAYTITANYITSGTMHYRPPMAGMGQANAWATCSAISDANYGSKRLLRRREQIAASAWPRFTGEPGALSDSAIASLEAGGGHSSGTFACNTDSASGISAAAFNNYELARDASGGLPEFVIGSSGTSQCTSRFGAQDMVGNVWEWTSDQLSDCSSSTHTCTGATSNLDSGNTDWNNLSLPGASSNATEWTMSSASFDAVNFSIPLGLPTSSTDSGNAKVIGSGITSAQMHNDYIWVYTDSSYIRGAVTGGGILDGGKAGRYALDVMTYQGPGGNACLYNGSCFEEIVGFRCALPAE